MDEFEGLMKLGMCFEVEELKIQSFLVEVGKCLHEGGFLIDEGFLMEDGFLEEQGFLLQEGFLLEIGKLSQGFLLWFDLS